MSQFSIARVERALLPAAFDVAFVLVLVLASALALAFLNEGRPSRPKQLE